MILMGGFRVYDSDLDSFIVCKNVSYCNRGLNMFVIIIPGCAYFCPRHSVSMYLSTFQLAQDSKNI